MLRFGPMLTIAASHQHAHTMYTREVAIVRGQRSGSDRQGARQLEGVWQFEAIAGAELGSTLGDVGIQRA